MLLLSVALISENRIKDRVNTKNGHYHIRFGNEAIFHSPKRNVTHLRICDYRQKDIHTRLNEIASLIPTLWSNEATDVTVLYGSCCRAQTLTIQKLQSARHGLYSLG
jgi:hypothetical protein